MGNDSAVAEKTTVSAENNTVNKLIEGLQDCIIGIDHVAIAVVDLAEAVDWYTNKLGFHLAEERETRGETTAMLSAVTTAGSAAVVLVQGTTPESNICKFIDHFGAGVHHVAFGVRDLDEAMERLMGSGGATDTPMIMDDGIRQAFLRRDPGSGVRVELIERTGGTFSDNTVQQLYQAFETNDLY